jgi:serine/threonine protein kinase
MVNTDPFIGQIIEKCRVERILSRGGYGVTYLAFDEELHTHRVIKVSHESTGSDLASQRQQKAFLEEGLILSRLKHSQIVTLRAQGEFAGRRYMVLDFVEGFSLREVLERLHRLDETSHSPWPHRLDPITATALITSTLEPLAYAHAARVRLPGREVAGIAHRDIAPGNLILGRQGDERGKVVLIDFGTAKTDLAEMVTLNQSLIGTLPYMSKPRLQRAQSQEQASAQQAFWSDYLETRNDIHALGILYAQLLIGKLPFRGETAPEILVSILDYTNYQRLYDEVAAIFPPALPFIQRMVVWYDVNQPLSVQGEQYVDAVSLKPDFLRFFHNLCTDPTPETRIEALSQTLRDAFPPSEPTLATLPTKRALPAQPAPQGYSATYAQPAVNVTVQENQPPRYDAKTLRFEIQKPKTPWLLWLLTTAVILASLIWITHRFLIRDRTAAPHNGTSFPPLERMDGLDTPSNTTDTLTHQHNGKPLGKRLGAHVANSNPNQMGGKPTTDLSAAQIDLPAGAMAPYSGLSAILKADLTAPWTRELFVSIQSRVRGKDSSVCSVLQGRLQSTPHSADLLYLKARWLMEQETPSAGQRADLAALRNQVPDFVDGRLYEENSLYWAWQLNLKLFQSQASEANRIALIQAGHAYLAAYDGDPLYADKVKAVQNSLPQ